MDKVARVFLAISLAFGGLTMLVMLATLSRQSPSELPLVSERLELIGIGLAIYVITALPGFLLCRRRAFAARLLGLVLAIVAALLTALAAIMITFMPGVPC